MIAADIAKKIIVDNEFMGKEFTKNTLGIALFISLIYGKAKGAF